MAHPPFRRRRRRRRRRPRCEQAWSRRLVREAAHLKPPIPERMRSWEGEGEG